MMEGDEVGFELHELERPSPPSRAAVNLTYYILYSHPQKRII